LTGTVPLLPPTVEAMEAQARERLHPDAYAYYAAGASREHSLEETVAAWASWHLRPRVLRDVSQVDTATTLLGQAVSMPIITAPTAVNGLAHPDGEVAVARAVRRVGTVQVMSTGSTKSLEEVGAEAAPLWFQLYTTADPEETERRIHRAEAAGARALVITVDLPEIGIRPRGLAAGAQSGVRTEVLGRLGRQNPTLDWAGVERLRRVTPLPIVLKGILHPDDARLAAEAGVAAIIVSNHGARQLDGELPSALALADIAAAVAGRTEVYVDSGIRDGTDVLRALALGARAVLIGRPYLWALTVAGSDGVVELLERLREELRSAMVLCGQRDVTAVEASIVVPRRGCVTPGHSSLAGP
jgi:isopentenyl diphosphate isomerase/L-lactate dehydrogenase-like FMN-dependent dehydrogenase